jgi:hypothetical protein
MFLSSRGLKNIVCSESTFVFSVNGREFEMSKFKAQFISPTVSRLLVLDPTHSSLSIEVPDAIDGFDLIASLCEGDSIKLDQSRVLGFGAVCRALGNDELINTAIRSDPVSITNVAWRLSLLMTDDDLEFACRHFDALDHAWLPIDVLYALLADPRLKITSEDWLLDVVSDRITRDSSLIDLLDFIECNYLSWKGISKFLSLVSTEGMSSAVWSSLCRRLQEPSPEHQENPRQGSRFFPLDRSRPFDGVFAYLTRRGNRNPATADLISITTKGSGDGVVVRCDGLVCPGAQPGSFSASSNSGVTLKESVRIDLKDFDLLPSGYSIKTPPSPVANRTALMGHGAGWGTPVNAMLGSWQLEVSKDGDHWEVLDTHIESGELAGYGKEASFEVSSGREFRFLRFLLRSASGNEQVQLDQLELFGSLRDRRE